MRFSLTVTLLLIFATGTAYGQNNVSLTQSGTNNTAQADQGFAGTQGPNTLTITQDGTGNTIENFGQYGSGNATTITQVGEQNVVKRWAEQGPKRYGTPIGNSFNGDLTIDQDGSRNVVHDADQLGWDNVADIEQNGKENWADLEMQYSRGEDEANAATIAQVGTNNAIGDKSGDRGGHQQGGSTLTLAQEGNGNRAGTTTLAEAGISDFGPRPLIGSGEQYGGRQSIVQAGAARLTLTQQGENNVVDHVLQNGDGNQGMIDQTGGENWASLVQRGPNNSAEITQEGTANTAVVTQDAL